MKYIMCRNNQEYVDENGKPIYSIDKLDRVNILVGENNSGKSRFIRNLIIASESNSNYMYYDDKEITQEKQRTILNYIQEIINSINYAYRKIGDWQCIKTLEHKLQEFDNLLEKCIWLHNEYYQNIIEIVGADNTIDDRFNRIFIQKFDYTKINQTKFFYIPILRGIENFEVYFDKGKEYQQLSNIQMTMNDMEALKAYTNQAKTIYKNKIRSIYGISENKIFTAEELYDNVVDILLGEETGRVKLHEFEKFISDNFYNGDGFSINPSRKKNCLMVKIKQDPEREIYSLGDGIKQLIVLLYPIFMHKDEEFMFFIEEPEINLHPGFQRKFMEILLSENFSKHTYFINTHSNHIIDVINEYEDVRLYKFKKLNGKKEIKIVDNDYVSILNDLGIRSSSIFLSNCTIWVEGISDRLYLRKYLELYFKEKGLENHYKENIHYSFVEYAGGNITHWNFDPTTETEEQINVNWLSRNVFLIVDNDNTSSKPSSKKNSRKEKLKGILQENYYELKAREIENYISLDILEKMLKKDNKLDKLVRLKYTTAQWPFEQKLLTNEKTYIGEFIDSTYDGLKKYSATYGKTVAKKADFANKICSEINNYNELTEEAKELTEKVAEFIIKNN